MVLLTLVFMAARRFSNTIIGTICRCGRKYDTSKSNRERSRDEEESG